MKDSEYAERETAFVKIVEKHAGRSMAAMMMLGRGIAVIRMFSDPWAEDVRKGRVYFTKDTATLREGSVCTGGTVEAGIGFIDLPDNTLRAPGTGEFGDVADIMRSEFVPASGTEQHWLYTEPVTPCMNLDPSRGRPASRWGRSIHSLASLGVRRS